MPKKRILVVGNFPTTSLTGQQVTTASGYDQAIEMLSMEDFDIIIMDAVIGATNGLELLKHIRKTTKSPTIVRYEKSVVYLPKDGRDWNIPIFVQAHCPFATLSQAGRGEWAQTRRLMEDLLQDNAV